MLKTPERGEFEVDEIALAEVVDEMLGKKNQERILNKASFWRAIYLYCDKKHLNNLEEAQAGDLYRRITPILIKVFKNIQPSFKGVTYDQAESEKIGQVSRYLAAERRLEDLNDRGPRLGA